MRERQPLERVLLLLGGGGAAAAFRGVERRHGVRPQRRDERRRGRLVRERGRRRPEDRLATTKRVNPTAATTATDAVGIARGGNAEKAGAVQYDPPSRRERCLPAELHIA